MQSTFAPFGEEALALRTLTTWMAGAAALIALGVLALAWHAVRQHEGIDHRGGMRLVFWLGGVGPTLLLTLLLVASLPRMRAMPVADEDLTIEIDGEQFWWRVRYRLADGRTVETANEVHLPVGRTVRFVLGSPDVIHSFWIPGLAGKMDMIPGRTNELTARAVRSGTFRGVCAEFCGLSHARMALDVVALTPETFDRWLEGLAAPAVSLESPGRQLFDEYGCAGCHVVRGHFTGIAIGPDLSHFGGRRTLAAGALPMTTEAISGFIRQPSRFKPGILMPSFSDMPPADARVIADYLLELE